MRILIFSVTPIAEAIKNLGYTSQYNGAGWMTSLLQKLGNREDISITVISLFSGVSKVEKTVANNIVYYVVPQSKADTSIYSKILAETDPEIVHIFGTETINTLNLIEATKGRRTIVHITGLVSIYSKHYNLGIPHKWYKRRSIGDRIRRSGIAKGQLDFESRGKYEIESIKKLNYVMGRTEWDKACTFQINSKIKYFNCNEILRDNFYKSENSWSLDNCKKNTIFISQGNYSIKGLHFAIEALKIIVNFFPGVRMYIAGNDILKENSLKDRIKMSSYGLYIKSLVKKYNLEENINFTGNLDELNMIDYMKNSHVFVSPSSIENSPNSLGEAMLIGTPSVASCVGGVQDLMEHNKEGFLYPADEPYMLAHYIMRIFNEDDIAIKYSNNAKARAAVTHNIDINIERLMSIYQEILTD